MRKTATILLIICSQILCGHPVEGQYYYYNSRFYESNLIWEIGAAAIGMNCLTDLGGRKLKGARFLTDLDWKQTCPGLSLSGKLLYNQRFGMRMETTIAGIAATDSQHKNKSQTTGRLQRNLEVESRIIEAVLLAECYPLLLLVSDRLPGRWFNPYFIGGVGCFYFNPVATTGKQVVALQPLRTEGQGFPDYPGRNPYKLTQWNIPFGIGLRYEVSALLVCGFEFLYRKLFTDYLDDVSTTYIDPLLFYKYLPSAQAVIAQQMADRGINQEQKPGSRRGNPANKDAYLSFNLKAAWVIGRERR